MIRLIFKQLDAREPLPLVAYYLGDGVVRSDRLAIAILGEECVSSREGGCRCRRKAANGCLSACPRAVC